MDKVSNFSITIYRRHNIRLRAASVHLVRKIRKARSKLRELNVSWFSPTRSAARTARNALAKLLANYQSRLAYITGERFNMRAVAASELGLVL